jgi:hypothetical protein
VVTVVVGCPLRILYVLRHVWNRRISVRQDSGDACAQQASPMLSYCNGLCFGTRYESSLWAQRNSHFTWPVASYGNGRCLMLVTNMSYQYLSWLICNTWSVTGALLVTKGNLCLLPKRVFHVVYESLRKSLRQIQHYKAHGILNTLECMPSTYFLLLLSMFIHCRFICIIWSENINYIILYK